MKTIIYIRVSTDRQDNSEKMQLDKCSSFCKDKGYDLIDVIIDSDISGGSKIFNRPGGKVLKDKIKNKEVDHIVCWKLDRLSRRVVDGLNFIETLNKEGIGISVLDINGETIDSNSAMGKFFLSLMLSLNEMERGIISERTSHILQNKKKNKEVYSRTPPYGYKKSGKSLIKVPKELEKVSRVLSMRKTGKSVRSISIDLVLGYNRVKRIIKDEEFYSS
jgi:DNA invertase Pin-like site-specific DNA recombinase